MACFIPRDYNFATSNKFYQTFVGKVVSRSTSEDSSSQKPQKTVYVAVDLIKNSAKPKYFSTLQDVSSYLVNQSKNQKKVLLNVLPSQTKKAVVVPFSAQDQDQFFTKTGDEYSGIVIYPKENASSYDFSFAGKFSCFSGHEFDALHELFLKQVQNHNKKVQSLQEKISRAFRIEQDNLFVEDVLRVLGKRQVYYSPFKDQPFELERMPCPQSVYNLVSKKSTSSDSLEEITKLFRSSN